MLGAQHVIQNRAAPPTLESPVLPCLTPWALPALPPSLALKSAAATADQSLPRHRHPEAPAVPLQPPFLSGQPITHPS